MSYLGITIHVINFTWFIKENYNNITKHVSRSAKNVMHSAMAFATDVDASSAHVSQFASEVIEDTQDYALPRVIARHQRIMNESNWIKIRESCCWVINETYIQLEV
jgi:hypothetical protein